MKHVLNFTRSPALAAKRISASWRPWRLGGYITCGLLIVASGSGCAATPRGPTPGGAHLRQLATSYINSALKYRDNPAVRAQAVEAAESLPPDIAIKLRESLKDEHAGVRFAACLALGRLKDADAAAAIREHVQDQDRSVRVAAYFALQQLGDGRYRVQWVETLRRDPLPAVRRNAALTLGQLRDPEVIPILQAAAAEDEDEGVRLQAMEGLAILGNRRAVERFIHDAYGGAGYKQPFALLTLGRVSDDRVLPTLRTRLKESPYLEARLAAARALGMHGHDDGFDLAMKSVSWNEPQAGLADDSPENQRMRVRSMAVMALGEIGDARALGSLKGRMETPDDPRVQLAAAKAIIMILKQGG